MTVIAPLANFNFLHSSTLNHILTLAPFNDSDFLTLDTLRKAIAVGEKARDLIRKSEGVNISKYLTPMLTTLRKRLSTLEDAQAFLDAGTLESSIYASIRPYDDFIASGATAKYGVIVHKDGKVMVFIKNFLLTAKNARSKVASTLAKAKAEAFFLDYTNEAMSGVFGSGDGVRYEVSSDGLSITKIS